MKLLKIEISFDRETPYNVMGSIYRRIWIRHSPTIASTDINRDEINMTGLIPNICFNEFTSFLRSCNFPQENIKVGCFDGNFYIFDRAPFTHFFGHGSKYSDEIKRMAFEILKNNTAHWAVINENKC